MKALVIEDSRTIRKIIAGILSDSKFEVVEAEDGKSGLECLRRSSPPDIVIVDWNMPELDGLGFIEKVRADSSYDAVPIMLVTTVSEKKNVIAGLPAGANEYLMKPFTKEMLLEKLALLGFEEK